MKKTTHLTATCPGFLLFVLGLLIGGYTPAFGVQGVVPYKKVLKDAISVATIHENWIVAQGVGQSMAPYYDNSSLLLIEKIPYPDLKPGMIAVYKDAEGQYVGHSLVAWSEEGWIAKGYNNPNADPSSITPHNLVGIIFGTLKFSGTPTEEMMTVHGKTFN